MTGGITDRRLSTATCIKQMRELETAGVYDGLIIGERNKSDDLALNITREKKLTNMRSSGSDNTVTLRPPRQLSLDQSIEFIAEDELVEVTPLSIRLRKMELDPNKRNSLRKKENLPELS